MHLRSPLLLSAVALLAGCGGEEPSQTEKVCDAAAEECGDFIAPPVPYEETYGASVKVSRPLLATIANISIALRVFLI